MVLGFTLSIGDAEAKRLGGGSSSGMQRQSVAPTAPPSAAKPAPTATPATAPAAPAAQPKRSWMGPLAGLAAGLGLAALASHFGFGEGMANMMLIGLLVLAVVMVIGFFMRKKAAAAQQSGAGGMQYAGAGADYGRNAPSKPDFLPSGSAVPGMATAAAASAATAANSNSIPADFDVEGFARNAKVNFIRLQAANDAGNLDDIREFTTPEMFAEIKLGMGERGAAQQETDVVQLNAEVLDVAEEANRYVVSVRFHGLIREDKAGPTEPFDEIWNMTKPTDGSRGWTLAGIQQV
ncbi:MAG TPA: Tim44-like domain-containing protein [Azonexus sp.]|nr:Tim44-like domain-containing protein [Azonexus sp.]